MAKVTEGQIYKDALGEYVVTKVSTSALGTECNVLYKSGFALRCTVGCISKDKLIGSVSMRKVLELIFGK